MDRSRCLHFIWNNTTPRRCPLENPLDKPSNVLFTTGHIESADNRLVLLGQNRTGEEHLKTPNPPPFPDNSLQFTLCVLVRLCIASSLLDSEHTVAGVSLLLNTNVFGILSLIFFSLHFIWNNGNPAGASAVPRCARQTLTLGRSAE